jgi:hypothetical protein
MGRQESKDDRQRNKIKPINKDKKTRIKTSKQSEESKRFPGKVTTDNQNLGSTWEIPVDRSYKGRES